MTRMIAAVFVSLTRPRRPCRVGPAGADAVLPPLPVPPETFVLPPVPPLPVLPEMPTLPELPPMPTVGPLPPMPPLAALPPLPTVPFFELDKFYADFLYQPAPKPQPTPRPQPAPRPVRVDRGRDAEGTYEDARQLIDSGRYERALEALDRVAAAPNSTRADAALYWKAYAQWKLDQRADALATLADMSKTRSRRAAGRRTRRRSTSRSGRGPARSVSPDGQSSEELKLLALRGLMNSDPDRAIPMIEQTPGRPEHGPRQGERPVRTEPEPLRARTRHHRGSRQGQPQSRSAAARDPLPRGDRRSRRTARCWTMRIDRRPTWR